MPFFLSDLFFRSLFHIENTEWTILCMESRLRAAFADLRFILSCSRLQSSVQCMLSIDQCLRTNETNAGVSVGRLLTYSLFSAVCVPDDLFTVSESYSITVMFPPPFFLVGYDVKTVKDTVGSGFDSAVPEFRPIRVGIHRRLPFEPVFHAITQGWLVRF